jgi:hypothetical protein
MQQAECSEILAFKLHTQVNHPEDCIQQTPITCWVGPSTGTDALETEVPESLLALKPQFL